MQNNYEDVSQEVAKIMMERGYNSAGYELGRKLHMEAMRNLRLYIPKKKAKLEAKILEEKIENGVKKTVYDYIPPITEPQKVTLIPLDALSNKDLRQMARENNDEEGLDERIEKIMKITSPGLRKAMQYVLQGDSFKNAAKKIGMSSSKLCQELGRLAGREKIQAELFWESN